MPSLTHSSPPQAEQAEEAPALPCHAAPRHHRSGARRSLPRAPTAPLSARLRSRLRPSPRCLRGLRGRSGGRDPRRVRTRRSHRVRTPPSPSRRPILCACRRRRSNTSCGCTDRLWVRKRCASGCWRTRRPTAFGPPAASHPRSRAAPRSRTPARPGPWTRRQVVESAPAAVAAAAAAAAAGAMVVAGVRRRLTSRARRLRPR